MLKVLKKFGHVKKNTYLCSRFRIYIVAIMYHSTFEKVCKGTKKI